jgi:hypothetical protein
MGNPAAIALGPGTLYQAALGSSEPNDLATGWVAAWVALGYTHEGSDFSYQLNTEDVEVAEELDPVSVEAVGRVIMVKFVLAEVTASNLQRSLNGGIITTGTGFVTFEPPAFGTLTRRMYGWESDDAEERWVFRQCLSTGSVEMARRKGAAKSGIPFELRCEKPVGAAPFKTIFASPARA